MIYTNPCLCVSWNNSGTRITSRWNFHAASHPSYVIGAVSSPPKVLLGLFVNARNDKTSPLVENPVTHHARHLTAEDAGIYASVVNSRDNIKACSCSRSVMPLSTPTSSAKALTSAILSTPVKRRSPPATASLEVAAAMRRLLAPSARMLGHLALEV